MENNLKKTLCLALSCLALTAVAQERAPGASLFLNEDVTTFVIAQENIMMVDISVPDSMVVANQATDNIVRMKALRPMPENAKIGVATVIGERNVAQYDLYYTSEKSRATTEYRVMQQETGSYVNPAVDMDTRTMYSYAWKVWDSRKRYYDVTNHGNRMRIRLNNLYSVGGYFFFDISIENRTNIMFDIEDISVKLCDKRQVRSSNYQEIPIEPVMVLQDIRSFKRNYRNVFVLKKLTFPDEKVLTFTFGEEPISGRSITLSIDYSEVLSADTFSEGMLMK